MSADRDDSRAKPLLLCPSCGKQQAPGDHMCRDCGSPLTPFGHTDPVMGVLARGFAIQQATTNPRKLIVVVGMWLWLFPLFVFGAVACVAGIGGILSGEVGVGLMLLPVGIVFVWIAGTILVRTTLSYYRQPQTSRTSASSEEPDDEAESMQCLDCGQDMPAQASACPSCGWSFARSNES